MQATDGAGLESLKTIVEPGPLFAFPTQPDPKVVHVVGMWRRVVAALIDSLVLFPVLFGAAWIGSRVAGMRSEDLGRLSVETFLDLFLNGGVAFYGVVSLVAAVLLTYGLLFLSISGRTPGLSVVRARVINVYGERPELWRVILRCCGAVVGAALLGLGLIWAGFDREKRGLHDRLAGTYVVRQANANRPG